MEHWLKITGTMAHELPERRLYFTVICIMAFLLERTLESRLKRAHLPASPQQIQEALNSMNFAEVKIRQKKLFIKTNFESLCNKILGLLHIKPPQNVTPTSELSL